MSGAPVRFDRDGAVATITLDRPDSGNAIDVAMAEALLDLAGICDTDEAIRCVVLTGAGAFFCAGGDVGLFAAAGGGRGALFGALAGTLHRALSRLSRMRKPLLSLVNGPAAGAGLGLAVAGDVVLAAESAHFTAAYTAIGLTPDGGVSWRLPRLVGLRRAQEMVLTNRRVPAAEAERIGLVTRVVADDALSKEGAALARRLADAPVAALGAARTLLLDSFGNGLETQMELEARTIATAAAGEEATAGIAAFLARRRPKDGAPAR